MFSFNLNPIMSISSFSPDLCRNFRKVFKNYESFWVFGFFKVIVADLDDIRTVLTSDECLEKTANHRMYFMHGLFVDSGERYKIQRKALNPLFQPSAFRRHIAIMNAEMDYLLKREEVKLVSNQINAKNIAYQFVMRIVAKTIFGVQRNIENHEIESIRNDLDE